MNSVVILLLLLSNGALINGEDEITTSTASTTSTTSMASTVSEVNSSKASSTGRSMTVKISKQLPKIKTTTSKTTVTTTILIPRKPGVCAKPGNIFGGCRKCNSDYNCPGAKVKCCDTKAGNIFGRRTLFDGLFFPPMTSQALVKCCSPVQ